ncbi:MDR family MFS transporter [Robertkochia aurantiaca]|uniref:MDR family MFS transporter n=1 Tax=Robertkochia aurantiaca TaxID=2873700 RepID=UPI001CCF2DEF|nr:MFS transporter [Robertkochia sp. 3YJGBD-33]
MKSFFKSYIHSFSGLSAEVWWLAWITLINRAGTMVIPFLSLYLTQSMGFDLKEVGWIMTSFGLGSLIGSWLGGKLTDRIGYYKVMVVSLLGSGLLFVLLQFAEGFWMLAGGIFLVMLMADLFRPAVFVALSAYSKPENKTRSVTLIRLAINLGFAFGPAAGGFIISQMSYSGLFWTDGLTCGIAGLLLLWRLNPKKARIIDLHDEAANISPYKDRQYLLFIAAMVLYGFIFLQYFSTIPIYYKEIHLLGEGSIGLIFGLNGLLIFVLEMPLIRYFETKPWSGLINTTIGCLLTLLSFLVLNLSTWTGMVIVGILLMSVGEMLVFPFSNAYALKRSRRGKQGAYMALYSIAFSLSHVFGHNAGMQTAGIFGYRNLWYALTILGLVCCALLIRLYVVQKRSDKVLSTPEAVSQ